MKQGINTIVIHCMALAGLIMTLLLGTGIYLDIADFDQTEGGYEAPYTNYTGRPVEWNKMDITPIGLAKRGRVINVLANARTGMISFEVFGVSMDWRTFSERAMVVHKPREAFIKAGFSPQF